jgi:hypothetical protein
VNDFDFYFSDLETTKAVAEYYVAKFKENPPQKHGATNPVDIEVKVDHTLATPETPITPRVRIYIRSAGIAGEEKEGSTYEYFESRPPETAEEYVDKQFETKESEATKAESDYRPVFLTDNAISLSGQVQLVIRFYGKPEEIHENYDFVHATNYWTSWDRNVTYRTEALECLLTKELRYIGSKYPICSLVRAKKFIQRDWTINAGQFLKMAWQINELDLNNFAVLREQLVGMDMAYFSQVLSELHAADPKKISGTYLMVVVDRIFG